MERPTEEESTDGSSIKPVSSLRSHFENMLHANKSSRPVTPRQSSPPPADGLAMPEDHRRADGRISLDIPRQNTGRMATPTLADFEGVGSTTPRGRTLRAPWSNSKPRPSSMVAWSPPRSATKSPPKVAIHSPRSPPKTAESTPVHSPLPLRNLSQVSWESPSPKPSPSNGARPFVPGSRNATPALEARTFQPPNTVATPSPDPRKSMTFERPAGSAPPVPPPINRAGKPKIPSKPHSTEPSLRATLAPEPLVDPYEDRVSPFSTPPSSSEGTPKVDPLPDHLRPRPSARDSYFPPPPVHHSVAERLAGSDNRANGTQPPKKSTSSQVHSPVDSAEDRPALPVRPGRDNVNLRRSMVIQRGAPPEPPVRRSMDTTRPAALVAETNNRFMPPPKRTQTFGAPGAMSASSRTLEPPNPPPPRKSMEMKRPSPLPAPVSQSYSYDSDDLDTAAEKPTAALTDYPDSSQANRRPPAFDELPSAIPVGYETKLFAICGEYICTTGYVTTVWSLLNGKVLLNLSHGDTVKVTSVAFRPAKDVEDEGKRLWLGTNIGEIHEIDIPTQSVVFTKTNAHPRSAILKIFRYASEMWSLDDEGKIHIWPPDETGSPILQQTPGTFRVPRGHTFSIISGSQLWIAFGKEIRVFNRTGDTNYFESATQGGLSQPNVGEVTAGAILSSQPDRIYFGHIDGKVSIYAKKGFVCLGIVSVSLYKISSLVGVGDHLWAGYVTGMIYVYDTSCTPWKVMKDWKAHEKPISGIIADRTSIWKLDRLQVASLGQDMMLRIWDGMLKHDWLESQMQRHDADYCDFREISAAVMTWNAGASKPANLQQNGQDQNFYRELLQPHNPPDILVFGFQELVDLEDKKVTAKSFFKKKKKQDATDQEHMSHQYRAWRDHLIRVLDEHAPKQNYTLVHTANLIGLFTCIFVSSSERTKVRDVSAAQIKLGMGGRYGNKGALVVRFFVDDSSLCFINCHLAAGQTQTTHRNNDVAAIMEAEALPRNRSPSECADFFVGGGDGSMILDHEICILNGDLNYRIDSMTRDSVIAAVRQGNLPKLLDRDQLLLSRKRNPGFRLRAFNEAPIKFAPTYKYDVGTDNYDSSEKKRSPAWCDRLLYRGLGKIKQTEYRRHDGVKVSDHRPVSGRFRIRVKTINAKKQAAAMGQAEAEFEGVKRRIAGDIKLDYLINVFGLSTKEAQRLLKGS
ncbi:Endonuclease/exonuclease/phosphatase [Massariosphaeria phaeospora]|uniref:Endonuclease/exonuclease/phosphatase n=1 Tax=Massariosphaeria phaeospora TaxID=100035 RepID=A0A7C8MCC0_9PLEO|nr:Endonuclease/exonuclease/phosphatase [Massariosphaeria phaeospora]